MRKYLSDIDIIDIANNETLQNNVVSKLLESWGALPSNYTRCNYIESTGLEYIQTNIVPNQDTRIIIDFEVLDVETPKAVFGARAETAVNVFGLWIESKEGNEGYTHVCPQYGSVQYIEYHILMNPKQRLFIDMYSTGCKVNGNISNWERSIFSTENTLTLLAINTNNMVDSRRAIGRLRSCRVYENGNLTLFLLPVINSNGEVGMYDKVENIFYGNSGEGGFIAG